MAKILNGTITLQLTTQEAKALHFLLGELSGKDTTEKGLDKAQEEHIQSIYEVLEKN